jgi:hypothetical protein
MKKIKEELLIVSLGLISLWGLFAASSEPLFYLVTDTFFSNAFLLKNEVFFNISSGFFVSTIFYVMIVYIPQKMKKREIQPAINRLIEDVIQKGERVIDSIDQHTTKECKLQKKNDYSLASIMLACQQINPKKPIDPDNFFNCSIGQQLVERENIAVESRQKLYAFMMHIDERIVHEIQKLDASSFGKLVYVLAVKKFDAIESLDFLAKGFLEYHLGLESIAKIYKDINKEYTNTRYFN